MEEKIRQLYPSKEGETSSEVVPVTISFRVPTKRGLVVFAKFVAPFIVIGLIFFVWWTNQTRIVRLEEANLLLREEALESKDRSVKAVAMVAAKLDSASNYLELIEDLYTQSLSDNVAEMRKGLKVGKTVSVNERSEAAPKSLGKVNAEHVNKFIKEVASLAISEMNKFGIPASIILAQGICESAACTSNFYRKTNNVFCVKCFDCQKWYRYDETSHCIPWHDDKNNDRFRKFGSRWESFRQHSVLITSGRYAKLRKTCGKDYRKWAYGLKSCGYATDKKYAEKLIGIIEGLGLQKYDK